MKLAVILQSYPSLTETFIARELGALERAGIDVRPVSLDSDPYRAESLAGPVCAAAALQPRRLRLAYRIVRENQQAEAGGRLRALRHAATALAVAEGLRAWGPDVLHAHFLAVPADVAAAVAALLGVPLTLSAHAWDIYVPPRDAVRTRASRAEQIFVCTEHGRETLAMLSDDIATRTRLMRHGLEPGELAAPVSTGDAVIAVGRLVPKKGFDLLIRACAVMHACEVVPRCRIAGDGPEQAALAALIDETGLGSSLELLGALDGAAVDALYQDARVLVAPSVQAEDGDRDGVPNVLLEAMARGVPVVVSNGAAAAEIVVDGENGLVVPAGDVEALADALTRVITDDELHEHLARGARQSMAAMDVDALVAPMVNTFRELAASA